MIMDRKGSKTPQNKIYSKPSDRVANSGPNFLELNCRISEWKILTGRDQFDPFVYFDSGYKECCQNFRNK